MLGLRAGPAGSDALSFDLRSTRATPSSGDGGDRGRRGRWLRPSLSAGGSRGRLRAAWRRSAGQRPRAPHEEHGVENTGPAGILVVDARREFSTLLSIECGLAARASTNDRFPTTRAPPSPSRTSPKGYSDRPVS